MSLINASPANAAALADLRGAVDSALEAQHELRETIRNMNGSGKKLACALADHLGLDRPCEMVAA